MDQGWQCPGCQVVYAPKVTKCECQTDKGKRVEPFAPPLFIGVDVGVAGLFSNWKPPEL